jgi:hypothetical protein
MPIQLKGKEYKTVAERLLYFWEHYPDYNIQTTVMHGGADRSCVVSATIISEGGEIKSTGHAEGIYQSSGDKVLEKTETTAVGRALAFLDKELMGTDVASADEIATWVQHGNDQALLDHVACVRDHWASIYTIKDCLSIAERMGKDDDRWWSMMEEALEAWRELGEDVMKVLWRAPSKGGIFTTLERKLLDEASTEDHKRRNGGASD